MLEYLSNRRPQAPSANHRLINGQVYFKGANTHGRFGLGVDGPNRLEVFILVPLPFTVIEISQSLFCTLLLTSRGHVYIAGRDADGKIHYTFTRLSIGESVTKISAMVTHTLLITRRGRAMVSIDKDSGHTISALLKIDGIASGPEYALVFGIDYRPVSERNGQAHPYPWSVRAPPGTIAVCPSGQALMVLTSAGDIYACGADFNLQFGLGEDDCHWEFVQIPFKHRVTAISVGATHSLLITAEGHLYVSGTNTHGQVPFDRSVCYFTRVAELEQVVTISAENYNTFVTTADGTHYGCGDNSQRQITSDPIDRCRRLVRM